MDDSYSHSHFRSPFFTTNATIDPRSTLFGGDMNAYYPFDTIDPHDAEVGSLSTDWDEFGTTLSPLRYEGDLSNPSSQYSTPGPVTPAGLSVPSSPESKNTTVDSVSRQQLSMEGSKDKNAFAVQALVDARLY